MTSSDTTVRLNFAIFK